MSGAVFLSYASQDADAARRIADALRDAGVEVWFDQSELRGGDAWDHKIRKQIKECALFMPIISAHTQERAEGYFRLEWHLAVDRSRLMADDALFLFPVVADGTTDAEARVPDRFREVQWTRLRQAYGGQARQDGSDPEWEKFAGRVSKLLSGEAGRERDRSRFSDDEHVDEPSRRGRRRRREKRPAWVRTAWSGVAVALVAYYGLQPLWKRFSRDEGNHANPALLQAKPTEAQTLVARSQEITKGGSLTRAQLDTAGELCDRAIQLDPTDATVWAEAARVDLLLIYPYGYDRSDERCKQALSRATRASNLAPDSFEVRSLYAQVIAHAGATPALIQQAGKTLRELHAERPEDKEVVTQLAEILRQSQRFEEAAKLFESIGSFELAGWSYFQGNQPKPALAMVDRALAQERSPTAIELKTLLLMLDREDLDAARQTIEQLHPSEQLNEMAGAIAAMVYLYQRNAERVKQVVQALPADYLVSNAWQGPKQFFSGLVEEMNGRPGPAAAEWRAGLRVVEQRLQGDPDNRQLILWCAWLQASLKNEPEAKRLLEHAQQVAGLDPDAIDRRNAMVWLRLGRDDGVIDAMEEFLHARQLFWEETYTALRFSPLYDRLRGNPRFEKVLRDNLPEGAKPFD